MFYGNTQQKLRNFATTYRHYDMFSQIAPGTLHEDLHTFYCCWRHKVAIKEVLCNTQYFYNIKI
jgi:hypothetical protein